MREEILPVAYGRGGNGKTVVFNTLLNIAGTYGHVMAAEALMQTSSPRHPEELARLEGIRLAIASEIPEDKLWNEQRLKLLTGEKIPARDMYGKSFVIDATHKLVIYGNFLPGLRTVNEAINGRIRILPHAASIRGTPQEIKGLRERLVAEYPTSFAGSSTERCAGSSGASWSSRAACAKRPSAI